MLIPLTYCRLSFAQTPGPSGKKEKKLSTSNPKKKTSSSQKKTSPEPLATKRSHTNALVRIKIPADLKQSSLKTLDSSASVYYLRTLSKVQALTSAIVIGRPLTAFSQRQHYGIVSNEGPTAGTIEDAWSIGPFQIDQVLYQNAQQGVTGLAVGQTIDVSETAAIIPVGSGYARLLIENCAELKQNSQYVVILTKESSQSRPVFYATANLDVGRFNTDGTDMDDLTSLEYKRSLRDEIASAYGVTFVTQTNVAPSLTTLTPSSAAVGGPVFTLTVTGSNFKNGATIKFGSTPVTTTFLSATQLSATIAASQITTAGTIPVLVTNPDNQVSSSISFSVTNTPLSSVNIQWAAIASGDTDTKVAVGVANNFPSGTVVKLEKQDGNSNWIYVTEGPANSFFPSGNRHNQLILTAPVATLPLGTNVRVRAVNGTQTSPYSNVFTVRPRTYLDSEEDDSGGFF